MEFFQLAIEIGQAFADLPVVGGSRSFDQGRDGISFDTAVPVVARTGLHPSAEILELGGGAGYFAPLGLQEFRERLACLAGLVRALVADHQHGDSAFEGSIDGVEENLVDGSRTILDSLDHDGACVAEQRWRQSRGELTRVDLLALEKGAAETRVRAAERLAQFLVQSRIAVGGVFAMDEDQRGRHDQQKSRMVRVLLPRGVENSTESPRRFPTRALPIGLLMEMRLRTMSTSSGPTIWYSISLPVEASRTVTLALKMIVSEADASASITWARAILSSISAIFASILPCFSLGRVVFRVFGEISLSSRFLDGRDDGRALHALEVLEVRDKLVIAFARDGYLSVGHKEAMYPFGKGRARPCALSAILTTRNGRSSQATA